MTFVSNIPIYVQVVDDIKRKVLCGELGLGDKLPSNSELAAQYKINPNTAQRVSKSLEQYGLCFVRRGIGTFISTDPAIIERLRTDTVGTLCTNFISKMTELGYSITELPGILSAQIKSFENKGE